MVDENIGNRDDSGWTWNIFQRKISQNLEMQLKGHPGWLQRFSIENGVGGGDSPDSMNQKRLRLDGTDPTSSATIACLSQCLRCSGMEVSREVFAKKNVIPLGFTKACCTFRTIWQVLFFVLTYMWVTKVWQHTGNTWHFSLDYHSCPLRQVVEIFWIAALFIFEVIFKVH